MHSLAEHQFLLPCTKEGDTGAATASESMHYMSPVYSTRQCAVLAQPCTTDQT